MSAACCPDYAEIKRLSAELGRPVSTLIVLEPHNDPFYAGLPMNRERAEWFARLWQEYGVNRARHIRRVHYILQAQPHGSVLMRDGSPYVNTLACWTELALASKHARYLGIVDQADLIDRRNPEPLIYYEPGYRAGRLSADVSIEGGGTWALRSIERPAFPRPPRLCLAAPSQRRPVMTEVWVEKSGDLDDVLVPICRRTGTNVLPCKGEQGNEACVQLVKRAQAAGCPVRVLYLSDFDPAGQSMPVAVARKIEFEVRRHELELDIQLRPIALTPEQCIRYELPRTPLKESESRAASFEDRFGGGATELDALEALHPGELGKIVEAEIARYQRVDPKVDRQFSAISSEIREALAAVEEAVLADHHDVLEPLKAEHQRILEDLAGVEERLSELSEQVGEAFDEIEADLKAEQPDLSQWEWPAPSEPDEHPDPVFDSRRSYLDQVDRYKRHQDRPTAKRAYGSRPERLRGNRRRRANGSGAAP